MELNPSVPDIFLYSFLLLRNEKNAASSSKKALLFLAQIQSVPCFAGNVFFLDLQLQHLHLFSCFVCSSEIGSPLDFDVVCIIEGDSWEEDGDIELSLI